MWTDDWIGIPYQERGRGPEYDCLGLFVALQRDRHGRAIFDPACSMKSAALQRLADRVAGQVETSSTDGSASQSESNASPRSLTAEQASGQERQNPDNEQSGNWEPVSYWPLIAASLIFALMHLGQGAAPIPLFLLSVGLGYLYRQTGSLIPCIVLHMILNSITLLATLLQ